MQNILIQQTYGQEHNTNKKLSHSWKNDSSLFAAAAAAAAAAISQRN